ncbi:unnamed protein product [Diatraea saccharalis]|uniref:Disintegrin and metalloproteinase domain-containing protein 12 n=1 Tax=Diatraea saccharalis TaxID=40085 RepID=A0A9N9RDX0_9NEOP|nr:unnamed protein product [Diatraea saccharalis]
MSQKTCSATMCNVCVWCLFIVCQLILLVSTKTNVDAVIINSASTDFSRHRIVQPTIHHGRTKREISTTREKTGAHHSDVTVRVQIDDEEYVLDLRLNEGLLTEGHALQYQKNGKTVLHKPKKKDLQLCQYSGIVRGKPGSWVAVSTCKGLRGVIYDGQRMRYIQPVKGNEIQSDHYIYDHSDLTANHRCGYGGGVTKNESYDPLLMKKYQAQQLSKRSRISRYKRDADDIQVRGPYNENKLTRYVELVLVSDYREFKANGESIETVHHQLKDVANIINSVYAPLNIFIALVGVVVWNERDEIQLVENGDETLNNFLLYRRQTLLADIPNDNAHLITRQKFREGVVGKALKGPICTYEFSGGVATNHSEVIGLVATTIAHEMGHNFGMEHDTEQDCECPDDKCIMSPSSTSVTPVHWSSCSLKSLALAFERGMDYCLRNKPKRLFDSPTCGNGFVEAGEQCDCGISVDDGRDPCRGCCHPDTCMLRANATCAAGTCCDLQTCRPKAAGTVCRGADRECDLPEYCTGYSEYCPADVHKMDASPCSDNQAYCVRGSCRSHTDQCRLLWGTTGESSHEKCYTSNNIKGNKNGNCGYSRTQQMYRQCSIEDSLCGMLHCRHLNERLEFGLESVAQLSAVFINNNVQRNFMVAMYIIFLGIIPLILLIMFLGYYSRHNVLFWWKKPRKSYVQNLVSNVRSLVHKPKINLPTIHHNLPLRNLMSKTNTVNNSQVELTTENTKAKSKSFYNRILHFTEKNESKKPLKKLDRKINKDDIKIANDNDSLVKPKIAEKPNLKPKPKELKPSVTIVKTGLASTTNEMIVHPNRVQSPKKASFQQRISRSASKFAANFQNNAQNNAQPVVHTLSNPDDMSSSLLRNESDRSPAGNINPSVNFFGNFKGFSLTPMDKNPPDQTETKKTSDANKSAKITPVHRSGSNSQNIITQGVLKPVLRSAPPLPVVPNNTKTSPTVKRTNSSVQNKIKAFMNTDKTEESQPVQASQRPVISSPILEASTCTAKELISPLQGSKTLGPIRSAPSVPDASPALPKRPLSMHSPNAPQKPLPEEPKKVKEGISLNRIASFLKQEKSKEKERRPVERSHSLPKNPVHQVKVPKGTDKVALRNLQISNPILQKEIDLPVNTVPVVSDSEDGEDPKAFVNRAQSMRSPAPHKPAIQSFGSMRQAPGVPRPLSVVGRPTAPPPPLPANETNEPSIYQNPKPQNDKTVDYVDCIEEKQVPLAHIDEESSDNIYAIIEESPEKHSKPLPGVPPPPVKTLPQSPPAGYNTPKPITSNSGSTESMGLLGEIVNEIQNRNFDSIYSSLTLSRKKQAKEDANRDSTYMNTDNYRASDSVYSNSGAKSNASTTSSGYLHPSAVNVPTYINKDKTESKDEPEKAPPSPTLKVNSKIPTFSRQVTPPNLKNTSTFRNVPQSPKNANKNINLKPLTNSPDVVSSCAMDTKTVKPPDVINNNKQSDTPKTPKPVVVSKPNDNRPPLRPAPTIEKKPTAKSAVASKPVISTTNVNNKLPLQTEKNPLNRVNSKVDSNVKSIADNLNKNKPKVVPKPSTLVQRTESNAKSNSTKLTPKPSNVASLQQKFENRKSLGKEIAVKK